MRRAALIALLCIAAAMVLSGAASFASQKPLQVDPRDAACAELVKLWNGHSYPPDRQWIWTIPYGCVYTHDRPRPAGCTNDRDLGCIATPDIYVRFQHRKYVFRLTLKGSPENALGLARAGNQLLVSHDGRGSKTRQRLFIEFRGTEFDGIIPANQQHGLIPDLGPLLIWRIQYGLDTRKGLCCPRVDPGNPGVSPFNVVPERLTSARPEG